MWVAFNRSTVSLLHVVGTPTFVPSRRGIGRRDWSVLFSHYFVCTTYCPIWCWGLPNNHHNNTHQNQSHKAKPKAKAPQQSNTFRCPSFTQPILSGSSIYHSTIASIISSCIIVLSIKRAHYRSHYEANLRTIIHNGLRYSETVLSSLQ